MNKYLYYAKNLTSEIIKKPIFIFGNQKSGATVIAALLAEYRDIPVTLDIKTFTVQEQDDLHKGKLTIE